MAGDPCLDVRSRRMCNRSALFDRSFRQSGIPAFRQTSATAVPSSACRSIKAICCSLNRAVFMENPPPDRDG
jgi:hypothetical protein